MDQRYFAPILAVAAAGSLALIIARARFRRELTLTVVKEKLASNARLSSGLCAHRGWHFPSDDIRRPLENTLSAYERAWTAGVPYCECDVTLTSDGEIILCHDDNLKRLALRLSPIATKPVSELSFKKELEFFPLKDGSRVPTLREVLHAARRSGEGHKLVIEIKGNDKPCARNVSELLATDNLFQHVALVMGFSLDSVSEFARTNTNKGKVLSMLLTVRRKGSSNQYFDLDQIDHVTAILKANNIDGLYLQYDKSYLSDERFVKLCQQMPIGVWGRYIFDPDNQATAEKLLERGARFVNTDFPNSFFQS